MRQPYNGRARDSVCSPHGNVPSFPRPDRSPPVGRTPHPAHGQFPGLAQVVPWVHRRRLHWSQTAWSEQVRETFWNNKFVGLHSLLCFYQAYINTLQILKSICDTLPIVRSCRNFANKSISNDNAVFQCLLHLLLFR